MKTTVTAILILLAVSQISAKDLRAVFYDMNIDCLMGGLVDNTFYEADSIYSDIGHMQYKTYTVQGLNRTVRGSAAEAAEYPCDWNYYIEFTEKDQDISYSNEYEFAVSCSWDPMPRIPVFTNTEQKTYIDATKKLLKEMGLKNPKIKLKQVIRIDLEGDGTEEVLVSASYYKKGMYAETSLGDYSVTYIRKLINGKVETIFADGGVIKERDACGLAEEFRFEGTLDLDGDGILEILLGSKYYEGSAISVLKIQNGKAVFLPIGCGCGV